VAAAWIPARADLPNTDVALLLVLSVAVAAGVGGRGAALVAAVLSATAFDFFDTRPYGQLFMTQGRDVVTAVFLVGAGVVVGELTVRLGRYRVMAARHGEDFAVMSGAAQLMGFGEEAPMVVAALAGELVTRLQLADCHFEAGPLTGERPHVTPDGGVVDLDGRRPIGGLVEVDLPVWAGGVLVGRYRMTLHDEARPGRDRLVAAVGIAEQAGAALAGDRRCSTRAATVAPRPRRLRLVR
jgi:hypothetical protein